MHRDDHRSHERDEDAIRLCGRHPESKVIQRFVQKSLPTVNGPGRYGGIDVGYKKEMIDLPGIKRVDNDEYAVTGELVSLSRALSRIEGNTLILFGDILFRNHIPNLLLHDHDADIAIIVDSEIANRTQDDRLSDFVFATKRGSEHEFLDREVFLKTVEFGPRKADHDGEFIGLVKLSARGTKWAREYLQANGKADRLRKLQMIDMLNDFVSAGRPVKIHYVRGGWIDVDSLLDLNLALRF